MPADLLGRLAAAQVADACDWARVYFLGHLPTETTAEFFMPPPANESELTRRLSTVDFCAVVESAQHA
jgi:hypothetical protein